MGILSEELKSFIDNNRLELSESKTDEISDSKLQKTMLNAVIAMRQHVTDAEKAFRVADTDGWYKAFGEIMLDLSTAMYNSGRKSVASYIDRARDRMMKKEE
jgi:hypothetical protein